MERAHHRLPRVGPGQPPPAGIATWLGERLDPFQRVLGATSGHVEGWALHAEGLADELDLFPGPTYRTGYLYSHAFRAARIVVDIALHLGLPVAKPTLSGPQLTPEMAVDHLVTVDGVERQLAPSEVDRYLGWPAQATCYKLGERVWREARSQAEARGLSPRAFHERALALGFVGLDQLLALAKTLPTNQSLPLVQPPSAGLVTAEARTPWHAAPQLEAGTPHHCTLWRHLHQLCLAARRRPRSTTAPTTTIASVTARPTTACTSVRRNPTAMTAIAARPTSARMRPIIASTSTAKPRAAA